MMFWIFAACLTAIVTILILRPLFRPDQVAISAADTPVEDDAYAHDREIYKDQINEIDRDLASGLIDKGEAELARVEISRRALAAVDRQQNRAQITQSQTNIWTKSLICLIIPAIGLGIYLAIGNPSLPNLPLALRTPPPLTQPTTPQIATLPPIPPQFAEVIQTAETHLKANPNDGRGWDALAPVYARIGHYQKSAMAFQRAIEILGPSADRHAGLGEAIAFANNGQINQMALTQFQTAIQLEANHPKSAFFLAYALSQQGKRDEAIAAYKDLLARSPKDAPWLEAVRIELAQLEGAPNQAENMQVETAQNQTETQSQPTSEPLGNPTAEDIRAAQDMSAQDRMAMINGMVESLSERLADEPNNFEGWQRLIRSFTVLGQPEKAVEAYKNSQIVFPPESEEGQKLSALASQLGLDTK